MTTAPRLDIIQDGDRASAVLHPLRRRLLAGLEQPNSAAGLARELDLPRQKVNYHLRELEDQGFVRLVAKRRKGNCTERIVQATATWYVISPEVLGALGASATPPADRLSSAHLVATAARLIRDVALLRARAAVAEQELPTLTVESEVQFRSAEDRGAFAQELTDTIARLAARYHDDQAAGGRSYRFVLASHPLITKTAAEAETCITKPTAATPSEPQS